MKANPHFTKKESKLQVTWPSAHRYKQLPELEASDVKENRKKI